MRSAYSGSVARTIHVVSKLPLVGVLTAAAAGRATSRLAGADRYTTAVEISKAAFSTTAPANVYLARGDDFPDALAAGVVTDGPVLLVPAVGPVPEAVLAEVQRLKPGRVVALGGAGVVSDALLAAVAGGAPTGRLAGETRYDTAVAISAATFPRGAAVVYLARGDAFPDALAAGALTDGPILLVPTCGALPAPVLAEVARLTAGKVVALGGSTAICDQLLTSAATGGTASEATYLSEQKALSSTAYVYREPASINGVVHARAVRFDLGGRTAAAEYDLGRGAARLRATVGLADGSRSATGRVQFDVFADGRSIYSKQVGLGESEAIDLDITGALRLRVTATGLTGGSTLPLLRQRPHPARREL